MHSFPIKKYRTIFVLALLALAIVFPSSVSAAPTEGDILWKKVSSNYPVGTTVYKFVEHDGDLYVSGQIRIGGAGTDYEWFFERRSGTTGEVVWNVTKNPTSGRDFASIIGVDSTGVYVTRANNIVSYELSLASYVEKYGLSDGGNGASEGTGIPLWSKYITNFYLYRTELGNQFVYIGGEVGGAGGAQRIKSFNKTTGAGPSPDKALIPSGSMFGTIFSMIATPNALYLTRQIETGEQIDGTVMFSHIVEKYNLTTLSLIGINEPYNDGSQLEEIVIAGISEPDMYIRGGPDALFSKLNTNNIAALPVWTKTISALGKVPVPPVDELYFRFKKINISDGEVIWRNNNFSSVGSISLLFRGFRGGIYFVADGAGPPVFRKLATTITDLPEVLSRTTYTLPDNTTEPVFNTQAVARTTDGLGFFSLRQEGSFPNYVYTIYKHTLIPSLSVDCSADIVLGTQKWASCNATQNPQYWYPGVDATTVDANGWPYGALYDRDSKETGVCSAGYHVPSVDEWKEALQTVGITVDLGSKAEIPANSGSFFYVMGNWANPSDYTPLRNALKLPFSGHYNFGGSGTYTDKDVSTSYWSNEQFSILNFIGTAVIRFFTPPNDYFNGMYHLAGLPLRCIADSATPPTPSTLKICQTSCNSLITRGKGGTTINFTMEKGDSQDLVACYNTAPVFPATSSCSDASGNVTDITTWTESDASGGPISLSTVLATGYGEDSPGFWKRLFSPEALAALMKTILTGNSVGTESFTATYNSIIATMNTEVRCLPVEPLCASADAQNTCTGQQYTMSYTDTCTLLTTTKQCDGTRYCDFNWREVAP